MFHDSADAVAASWESDRRPLTEAGLTVSLLRERPSFVEAEVADGVDSVRLDWVRDSASRFFPLVEHDEDIPPPDASGTCVLSDNGELLVGGLKRRRTLSQPAN